MDTVLLTDVMIVDETLAIEEEETLSLVGPEAPSVKLEARVVCVMMLKG